MLTSLRRMKSSLPDDGDASLIRWMLSLTPDARLAVLQGFVDSAAELTDLEARYEDLLPDTVAISVGSAIVRVLGLSALIRTKEEAGREKDLAVLGLLRRTLLESGKK